MKARNSHVPVATYRLQLTPSFTFSDAAAAVPYLAKLGISHLYLSPVFAAAPGSEHGYDVIDHSRINEELGGIAGLYELQRAASQHDLRLILDIVPNHVGLAGGQNRWWRDVMRLGRASSYASYFDIDWEGQAYLPAGVLVYPILGRPSGEALEAGELVLERDGGELVLRYFEHTFPVAPATYGSVLGLPPPSLATEDPSAPARLAETIDALGRASPLDEETLLAQLRHLVEAEPAIAAFLDAQVAACNGRAGEPASFDRLDQLLALQPYRLASWRVSAEEINYRRFFDINELAAIRVEHGPVFDEVHQLVGELVRGGMADGLRVDHVDGLYDPQAYLRRLDELLNGTEGSADTAKPIYVEKILAWDEPLPAGWRVAGTTGYEALARFDRVFIDPRGKEPLTATYQEFSGRHEDFAQVAFGTRRRVAERTFAGELNVLATHLHRLAQSERRCRDITLRAHHDAIAAFVACLPVYRTYLEDGQPRPIDDEIIDRTSREASARDPNASGEALGFLCEVLLLQGMDERPEERERRMHFRQRLQQLSSPVMAKGVEDTAFYRYNRLLSLNEVGSSPAQFGTTTEELHQWFRERAERWPHGLSATTTHDTKRSEDARARLGVLSELPSEWRREVRAWARSNSRFMSTVDGSRAPGANLEYYYYQTLLAAWDGAPGTTFRQRIAAHMTKAMREAKEETAWTRVNAPYEEAVQAFVRATLDRRRSRPFLDRLARFSARVAPAARLNTLGMLTLKATTPGVPDFYQGSETLLTTLTDPDNRGRVDFAALAARAQDREVRWEPAAEIGDAKFALTRALLAVRSRHPELFSRGRYVPLEVSGALAEHVFAFMREWPKECVLVVVPRLTARLPHASGTVSPSAWEDTAVSAPRTVGEWRNVLTGDEVTGGASLPVGELLRNTPVGVFEGRTG